MIFISMQIKFTHTQTSVSRVWLSSSKLPGEIQVLVMQIACLELRLGRMNVGSCDSNYCTMVLYVYECGQGEVHTGRLISQANIRFAYLDRRRGGHVTQETL